MADFPFINEAAFSDPAHGGVKLVRTPQPSEGDPREKALKVPTFQAAPKLNAPEWISGDLRGVSDALSDEWSTLVADQTALVEKLTDRLSTDPMKLSCAKPGARMKEEYALLVREIALREKTEDHLFDLIAESRPEEAKRAKEILAVRLATTEKLEGAVRELGIPETLLADRLHSMVSLSGPVLQEMKFCREVDKAVARWNGMDQKAAIETCRERMQAIATELIGLC